MKLIGSLTSPFVRKVRIVLAEKKIDCEFEIDIPIDPNTRVPQYNPLGKIPVLITDERLRLFDSRVIIEYLDASSSVNRLIPEASGERIEVRRWEALADGMLDAMVLLVQEGRRPKEFQYQPVIERQRAKIDRGLATAAAELANNSWCNGDAYSLADIALGCMLGFLDLRFPEIDWRAANPNLAVHAEKLFAREAFRLTVPQH